MVKVKAIKPVFYEKWRHPGDDFECKDDHLDELEKSGKIKVLNKSTGNIKKKDEVK